MNTFKTLIIALGMGSAAALAHDKSFELKLPDLSSAQGCYAQNVYNQYGALTGLSLTCINAKLDEVITDALVLTFATPTHENGKPQELAWLAMLVEMKWNGFTHDANGYFYR